MTAPVAPTARRSIVPFIAIGIAALVFGIANVVGSRFFPYNAPVEQAQAFGFTFDAVALLVLVLAVVGVVVARQPLPARPTSRLALIGMLLTAGVLVLVLLSWASGLTRLAGGTLLHYSDETWAAFLLAPVWITGMVFCGFAFRRGGGLARNNLFSLLGIGFGIVIYALAALSAVLYGLGLTT